MLVQGHLKNTLTGLITCHLTYSHRPCLIPHFVIKKMRSSRLKKRGGISNFRLLVLRQHSEWTTSFRMNYLSFTWVTRVNNKPSHFPKAYTAYFVHIININTLKSIIILFHYKIWNKFFRYSSNSGKIFTLQNKIVRITDGAQHRASCKSLFIQSDIVPVPCQYIPSLMNFIIKLETFLDSSIHNINTRNTHHLHRPNANLSCFQRSVLYAGIKIFNNLLPSLTILTNDKANFIAIKVALWTLKYSLPLLCRWIFYVYRRPIILFHKIFVKTVCICVFMTCSASYCVCDPLTGLWNMCTYIYICYVRILFSANVHWMVRVL